MQPDRPLDVRDLGTLLAVFAHPDDETHLAGATMAAAVDAGHRVVCVTATAGERGTDDPAAWPPERLGRTRRWEAAAAMAVLGVDDHRFLDLPDGGLAELDPAGPVAAIAAAIRDVAPGAILTFGPDGMTGHPDHRTVSAWVTAAWCDAGRRGRVLHATFSEERAAWWQPLYERAGIDMGAGRLPAVPARELALRVVLDDEALDRKAAALLAMHTQAAPLLRVVGEEAFRALLGEECFVDRTPGPPMPGPSGP